MKKLSLIVTTSALLLWFNPARAQLNGAPGGPQFDGALLKIFGENSAFTATLESQIKGKSGDLITLAGKFDFDAGKSRFQLDFSKAKGLPLAPDAMDKLKSLGLDQITSITLPEKKMIYLVYPGLKSYLEKPLPDAVTGTNQDFKITTTELGKETVDGHSCVENRVLVVSSRDGTNEFTVWNATDLNKFPVKIVRDQNGTDLTMSFTDVSLAKPPGNTFDLPAGYTRYDDMQTMMQTEMIKKMGGGLGLPAAH